MKQLIKTIFITALLISGGILGVAKERTEICRGSGYHCMEVDYGGIIAKFVKGKDEPGAVIPD